MTKKLRDVYFLWDGWECDSEGGLWEREDGLRFFSTRKEPIPYSSSYKVMKNLLLDKIEEYKSFIEHTKEVLTDLENQPEGHKKT